MTKARLLLVVSESGSITTEARTARRATYQEVADKIGAELLVTAEGCGAQLIDVPLLTEVAPSPGGFTVVENPVRRTRNGFVVGLLLCALSASSATAGLMWLGKQWL